MSLELPGPAVVAFNLVGLPWPGLDEDVLRAWAKDLRAFSAQVSDSSGRSRDQVAALAGADPSPPAKALLARWEHYHGVISALRGPVEAFAGALDVAADAVVAQKGIVIAAAVALAAEVVATQGEALFTFGLAEAEVPAEVAATRLVVKGVLQYLEGELLGRLVGAACSQLSAHLGGAVSKLITGGGGAAVEASSLKATYDQGTLQSLGTALNGHQAQVDNAGAGSLRLASGRQLATGGPGGGWREVAVAVEQAVLRMLAQLFKDLAHAFHTIVDDTTAAIKSMIHQLKHMDAERPSEEGRLSPAGGLGGEDIPPMPKSFGRDPAEEARRKTDAEINQALDKANPRFDKTETAYSQNCTGVAQAYELQRRGYDVAAGPLEKNLRTDEGGPGGRSIKVIEDAWGRKFTPATKAEIEEAFKEPGSRGVVFIKWKNELGGGGHVFNVENNGGKVRFVDAQPTPARQDVSYYFDRGQSIQYVRLDDRPTPPGQETGRYLES